MRRLATLLVVLAAGLPASAQEEGLTGAVFRFPGQDAYEPAPEPVPDPIDDFRVAPEPLLRLLARKYRVRATAIRFEGAPPVADLEDGVSPILSPEDEAVLRKAIRDGRAELLAAAEGSGRAQDRIAARSTTTRLAVIERDLESGVGVSTEFPVPMEIRSGLDLSARIVRMPGRGVMLRYRVLLVDSPELETRPTLGGPIEEATVPAILMTGGIRLVPGETAAAVFRDGPDGAGRGTLLLLHIEGPAEPTPALIDGSEGDAIAVAGHLGADGIPALPWPAAPSGYGFGFEFEDEDEEPVSAFDDFVLALGDEAGYWGSTGVLGLYEGNAEPPGRALMKAALTRAAECRGRPGRLVISSEGRAAVSVPLSPGESFSLFSGRLRATWGGIEALAGCNDCLLGSAATAYVAEGFAGSGRAAVDGTADLRMEGSRVLGSTRTQVHVRRIQAGYRGYSFDPAEVLLETGRTFRFHGSLPVDGTELPGDLEGEYRLAASSEADLIAVHAPEIEDLASAFPVGGGGWLLPPGTAGKAAGSSRPDPFVVNGRPLPLRPGAEGLLVDAVQPAAIRRWEDDGWCGMRMRYPVPDFPPMSPAGVTDETVSDILEGEGPYRPAWQTLWEGVVAALRVDREGRIAAVVEVRGAPEDLGRFDPGDGAVDIIRQPRLRAETKDLEIQGGGRLAFGGGREITVTVAGREPGFGPHRLLRIDASGGEAGLVAGRIGLLEAGGVTLLPQGFEVYSSNHDCGEVSTSFAPVADGLTVICEEEGGVVYTDLFLLGPATRIPHRLSTAVYPPRDRPDLATLSVFRRRLARAFVHEADGSLDYESPKGSQMPFRLRAGGVK